MAKMGRPNFEFGPKEKALFETLMGIDFVRAENICDVLGCCQDTLVKWIKEEYGCTFSDLRVTKRENMKLKLAAKQYETAMKGNVPMQIWLGKQWLDQREKKELIADVQVSDNPSKAKEELEALKAQIAEKV